MKARNLTAIAVVATGAVALGAPAAFAQAPDVSGVNGGLDKLGAIGKSAKKQARAAHHSAFQKRTGADIKRLGDNVRDLRKKDDEITFTISSIVGTITPILGQLGAAAASYADFQYGVVQLSYNGVPGASGAGLVFAGDLATSVPFVVTPRLDPTSQQSTATAQFRAPGTFNGGTGKISATVAVRSLNDPTAMDNKSTAFCRVTAAQPNTPANIGTTKPNATYKNLPFEPVQRSPIKPTDSNENVTSLVSLTADDKKVAKNLLGDTVSWNGNNAAQGIGGFNATAGEIVEVTLSCMYLDNQLMKDNGFTPPFAQ